MAQRAKLPKLNLTTAQPDEPKTEPRATVAARHDREGKKIIAGHFPRSTWAELRRLAVDRETTAQELLEEALADLFAKHRRK
ncbi:MAG: hypothetical protein JO150_13870 [Acidobacteriaceae bacterium]|nr:hypothetical protein [Acidobacteriaceae bacterium]